jgi:tricorn protease
MYHPHMRRFLFSLLLALPLQAADLTDTRLLTDPAISAHHIAFAYANDIWLANPDGSGVRRLTSHIGIESSPKFSPDGSLVAFTGAYDGNTDAYVVPATGGVPKRLTYHPGPDTVVGFTADGSAVLFSSPAEVHTRRYTQLYTVPVSGGAVSKLPVPNAHEGTYSRDGRKMVYQPIREVMNQWKHYRGGTTSRLLLYDLGTYAVEQIPQPATRSNDTDGMWIGERIYFRSDRDGEFNLYSFDPASKRIEQLTTFTDFPIVNASAGGGKIIFEQAGWLHLFDPAAGKSSRLKIGVAADLVETRPRFVKGAKYVRNGSISPSGARAVLEIRGEIVTMPAEKGDDRNLTQSVAAHDRSPVWSPDGKSIAWFTDETGEYELRIAAQDGKGTPRRIRVSGAGFYEDPKWSPDGKLISYSDNSHSLYVVDVASGASSKISSNALYRPGKILDHNWSPDSKWLAHTRTGMTNLQSIHLWSADQKKSFPVTDGVTDAREPVFDPNGKYLYFVASTDAGPVADWFSQSNNDMRATNAIYLAVLNRGVESPLAKQTDEEKPSAPETTTKEEKKEEPKKPVVVTIDFERLGQRIQALPLTGSNVYSNLAIGSTGKLLYLKSAGGENRFGRDNAPSLMRFDLEKRKEETLLEKVNGFDLSRDGKRLLLLMPRDKWAIAEAGDKVDPSKYPLAVDNVEVRIDPAAEWKQIFDEAWRINRDYFYDPGMHGSDWPAMKDKYAAFLPHVSSRADLNRVIQWMSSELAVGHHRGGGGDSLADTTQVPGGLLGADYKVENGRYRFAKVYGGLNWNPDLRAPLTEPGVDVREGEYLLAVDGKELKHPENLYARFERTAGRIVEITVGPNADGTGSRVVKVVPIEDEAALRNRDWVERNLRYVTEKTNGRVAYVYVPNTGGSGHEYFKRYFFPQADREAIIVDERYNGGGQVADYYIDILRRPYISMWAMRYGADLKTPLASIQGPKVMLIDENAGSGGDLLPWMFRKLQMGTLIGRRTWGGLVGVLGFPVLMDGGTITAPNLAIWTDEGFIVENEGVPPDIEIEQTPADVLAGRDPQLDKAIEVVMKQLAENPPVKPKKPAYPVRAR